MLFAFPLKTDRHREGSRKFANGINQFAVWY
jgi:hypothetical protein